MIPLRRIVQPFGYGAASPVADNTSKEGREQNRRVEVKILVSKGLTAPATTVAPVPTTAVVVSSVWWHSAPPPFGGGAGVHSTPRVLSHD